MRHNTIVVTGWDNGAMKRIHLKACQIFFNIAPVSEIIYSYVNGYISFFIAPDGSKEGWRESNNGDKVRKEFVNYLKNQPCNYVEVQFADEQGEDKIIHAQ